VRAAATALAVVLGTAGPVAAGAPAPLDQAREAAERVAFEGVLRVRWWDGDVTRSERLKVQAAGGSLVVTGANLVMAQPAFGRLVAHAGHGWEEIWLPSLAPTARPDGVAKYATTAPTDGPAVAGRPTRVIEVLRGAVRVERLYLDTETNLLLEREQFDPAGTVVRTLAFESLQLSPSAPPPPLPHSPAHHAPQAVGAQGPASPAALADGYERLGIYRDGSVLHVLYSDGLYDLSLFEQSGRLRRSDLPSAGERVAVAGATGWRYPWAGGQVVVWSAGGRVFTAVSDAPVDQVLAAVRSLPALPTRELSMLGKVRRAAQALIEPLS
jgi:sigma-E factor negative regulatory protein RseB